MGAVSINTVIDIAVISWMTGSVVLLWLFARFGIRTWNEHGITTLYERISFFVGLICHHIGNLILLSWFWAHRSQITIDIPNESALLIPAVGMLIATYGVFYKIRVFSYTPLELYVAIAVSVTAAILYAFILV